MHALPNGSRLAKRYRIERLLGNGGFGLTYLARDEVLNARVAIKEYFPRSLAGRAPGTDPDLVPYSAVDEEAFAMGLRGFLEEARAIEKIRHENVLRVRDFFEQNRTAYLVMDYYEGHTLTAHLSAKGRRLPEEDTREIAVQVLNGLGAVHECGYLHRDIKPLNLYLLDNRESKGQRVIILDFGAARSTLGRHTQQFDLIYSEGFAPIEQYRGIGLGPWTDLYALGATLYECLTGQRVPGALVRQAHDTLEPPERLGLAVSSSLSNAIMRSLRLQASARPQSVREFRLLLEDGGGVIRGGRQVDALHGSGTTVTDRGTIALPFDSHPNQSDDLRERNPATQAFGDSMAPQVRHSQSTHSPRSKRFWGTVLAAVIAGIITAALLGLFKPMVGPIESSVLQRAQANSIACHLETDPPVYSLKVGELQGYRHESINVVNYSRDTLQSSHRSLDEVCERLKEIHQRHFGFVEEHRIDTLSAGENHYRLLVTYFQRIPD